MPPMFPPTLHQWPRGPANDLHNAAHLGSTERTIALLSLGSIDIDQGDPKGWTPLMVASQEGHSSIVRIMLSRKANVSIATDAGDTALHISAQHGHLAVTVDLIKAGADINARNRKGGAPLHMTAKNGHSEVLTALIDAGAEVDSRSSSGATPLFPAAMCGRLEAVKTLLRAKANPLLAATGPSGCMIVPLDAAAQEGHSEVVHELISQVGIEGCAGVSGGEYALLMAATKLHLDIMAMLLNSGVVDSGIALCTAAGRGSVAVVKLLLQQRPTPEIEAGYLNFCDGDGTTPLFRSVDGNEDVRNISSKVARLLIDAGADTSSAVRVTKTRGVVMFDGTPLAYTNSCLRKKRVRATDLTEEQMHGLEAVRRLLLRVEAVYAISWLWPRRPLLVHDAAKLSSKTNRKTALMLPTLRRRRRGALFAPLFRYASYP